MTTEVPHGPEFSTGHASYPPAQETYAATTPAYPPVSYPQEGAAGYPEPVAYPQPSLYPTTSGSAYLSATAQPPADAEYLPAADVAFTPAADVAFTPAAAQPPAAAYPTAPPWAPAAEPAAAAGPGPAALPQFGGLLVPFPDEMQHASRAQPPAVWPVAIFTLLFGILGAISAKRRADQARRGRNSMAPYWLTFLVTLAAGTFVWFVVSAVVITPLVDSVREGNRLEAVQTNVVKDGQLTKIHLTVTEAHCRPVTDRNAEGLRDYKCQLTLGDGRTGSLDLTADTAGQWTSRPAG